MSDEEKMALERVLHQVEALRDRLVDLENSIIDASNRIDDNCLIDGNNPRGVQLNDSMRRAREATAAFNGYVIPNLVNRINS